ncbi:MAG: hypothetical protein ACP5K5_03495, partial [Candidatus Micrarchaeia archaeon]
MRTSIALLAFLSLSLLPFSYATTAIGISFPKVVPSHVTLYLNDSTIVNYTFTLVNGSAGSTCIGVPDSPQLQSNGTYVALNPSVGVPPFNGTMMITTKPNAVPGNYTVQLAGGCADPTTRGIAVVYLQVLGVQKPVTSTTAPSTTTVAPGPTTVPPQSTSVPPTTYIPPPIKTAPNSTLVYTLIAIIIIAIIIIIVAFYKMKHKYY